MGERRDAVPVAQEERLHGAPDSREERAAQRAIVTVDADLGEVEHEHEVAAPLGRRMLVYPEAAEERLELLLPRDVVIVLEQADEERLAHPSRPKKQERARAKVL